MHSEETWLWQQPGKLVRDPPEYLVEGPAGFKLTEIVHLQNKHRWYKQDALRVGGVDNPALNGKIEVLDRKLRGPLPSFCHVELGLAQLQLSFEHCKERSLIVPIGTMCNFNCDDPKEDNKVFCSLYRISQAGP